MDRGPASFLPDSSAIFPGPLPLLREDAPPGEIMAQTFDNASRWTPIPVRRRLPGRGAPTFALYAALGEIDRFSTA